MAGASHSSISTRRHSTAAPPVFLILTSSSDLLRRRLTRRELQKRLPRSRKKFGRLNVLVNNAGIAIFKPTASTSYVYALEKFMIFSSYRVRNTPSQRATKP